MRNNLELKFQGQWLMGPSLGRGALGSISCPFKLLDSQVKRNEKVSFQIFQSFLFFQDHSPQLIFSNLCTNLPPICFQLNFIQFIWIQFHSSRMQC